MPRARSPNRERAFQLWQESKGKRELKDIAAELGVSPEQVRKWKHADNWNAKQEKDTLPKKKGNVTKRRRGAPLRNQNAVGNSGGAAPLGNTNALKHGGYSPAYLDTLTDEERALIEGAAYTGEDLLREEISLLSIRERRILARIRTIAAFDEKTPGGMGLVVAGVIRSESKREFDSPEDKALYESIQRAKVERGDILPGRKYNVTTRTEATYDVLQRLEEALTRCQAQKQRCIQSFIDLQKTSGDTHEVEDLDEVEALIYGGGSRKEPDS